MMTCDKCGGETSTGRHHKHCRACINCKECGWSNTHNMMLKDWRTPSGASMGYGAESFESDTLSAKEYVKLAKNIETPYEKDDWNDLYVEGYIDCLVDNELTDDFFDAESFEAESDCELCGKSRKVCNKEGCDEGWGNYDTSDGKNAESFEANAGGLKCNVCQNMVADTDGDKYFVCDACANYEGMGAESFEADMTVADGFKLGVGAILGFTAIGAAFGLLGNVIGNLIGTKEE